MVVGKEDENKHVAQTWSNMVARWKKPTGSYGKWIKQSIDSKSKNTKNRCTSLEFWPSDITWSQWPAAASASSCASASLASISSDRSRCALAEPDWHRMFGLGGHAMLRETLQLYQLLSYLFQLGYVMYVEWWGIVGSGWCWWQVTWTALAADKRSGLSSAICGIKSVKSKPNCTKCWKGQDRKKDTLAGIGQVR